jgi:hypothetical protein
VAAGVSTLTPPCASAQATGPAATATPSSSGASGPAQDPSGTSGPAQASSGVPATPGAAGAGACATGEPAGAQAADGFLHEVVPQIMASAAYREGGLIAITFTAAGEGAGSAGAPAAGSQPSPPIAYPAGTGSSTLTATGAPGALLLSPFLRHRGARLTGAFDQLEPRKSLEELLGAPPTNVHR